MELSQIYNEILLDHNLHPANKYKLEDATCSHEGINPSCGDDITLQVRLKDGVIEAAAFEGHGCAISQASADMMADLVTGKTVEEAKNLCELFVKMILGEVTDEETLKKLDEAESLKDVSHMPARVKCAVLAWHTLEEMLDGSKN